MSWCCSRRAASPAEPGVDFQSLLRRNYKLLSRCLVVSDELLVELMSVEYMRNNVSRIRQQTTADQKVAELLNILCVVPQRQQQSVFSTLLAALRQDGQEHVANVFIQVSNARPMSDEHFQLIVSKQHQLVQYTDPLNGLLDELIAHNIFNYKDKSRITERNLTYTEMSTELVNMLLRKSDCSFDKFIEALDNAEQQHVVHIMTGQGESPLSRVRRLVLRKARKRLVSRVDTVHTSLLAELISNGVLTDVDKERIEAHTVNEDRTAKLIDVIARKSQLAYDKFIQALKDSGHHHIAEELEGLELRGQIDPSFLSSTSLPERKRIVQCVRSNLKTLVSGEGYEVEVFASLMEQNGFAVTEINDGSIHIAFRCFAEESFENLRRLYVDGTFDKLLTQVFCPPFAEHGLKSLTLHLPDSEFQKTNEAFRQIKMFDRSQQEQINVLPVEMLELVLMRSYIELFTDHYKSHYKTHEANRLAYSTLAAVCYNWWQTMNGWPQSTTKHWFKHNLLRTLKLLCRPYVVSPCLQSSLPVFNNVCGITQCDNKLFVLCFNTILVFGPNNKQLLTSIELEQLNSPRDIVCCTETQQMYVAGESRDLVKCVWRVSLDGRQVVKWLPNNSTKTSPTSPYNEYTLSVTSRRLLLTSRSNRELFLYDSDGVELKRVLLPDMKSLQHAVETSRGTFIVGHSEPQPRVCEVNADGDVTRVYCDQQHMSYPVYLSLDSDGRIFVADFKKDRVLLVNSETLELERVLLDKQHQLTHGPWRLCYTEQTRQLAVASLLSHSIQLFSV